MTEGAQLSLPYRLFFVIVTYDGGISVTIPSAKLHPSLRRNQVVTPATYFLPSVPYCSVPFFPDCTLTERTCIFMAATKFHSLFRRGDDISYTSLSTVFLQKAHKLRRSELYFGATADTIPPERKKSATLPDVQSPIFSLTWCELTLVVIKIGLDHPRRG